MKLQRQGYNECVLATIAMLADKPLDEIRSTALVLIGSGLTSWAEYMKKPYCWNTILDLYAKYGLSLPIALRCNMVPCSSSNVPPDLSGKGQIIIEWKEEGAHSMAFEEGLVFDPNADNPETWEEWISHIETRYPGATLGTIFVNRLPKL